MEGKLYINGAEVKRSNSDSLDVSDNYVKTDFPISNKGELSFDLRPNWLWQHKQKTGIPKNIEIMPWQ